MTEFNGVDELQEAIAGRAGDVGNPAVVLAQFDHGVFTAIVENSALTWCPSASGIDPVNLIDLRLFGPAGELHIWRQSDESGSFEERFRGDAGESFEENQALWGTDVDLNTDGMWVRVFEARGISYELPVAGIGNPPVGRKILPQLKVRHYYTRDEGDEAIGLARVVDSRLVSLHWGEE